MNSCNSSLVQLSCHSHPAMWISILFLFLFTVSPPRLSLLIRSLIVLLSFQILLLSKLNRKFDHPCSQNSFHSLTSLTSVLNPTEKERNHIITEQQSGLFDRRKRDWKGQEPDSLLLQGKANSVLSKGMPGTA